MAPKGMKRQSVGKKESPAKKSRAEAAAKCKEVEAALKGAEQLAPSVRAMVGSAVGPALASYKDARHEIQNKVVSWIGEALNGIEARFKDAATAASDEVTSLSGGKTELEAAVKNAEETLVALKEAAVEAENKFMEASKATEEAESAILRAEGAEKDVAKQIEAATKKKDEFDSIMAEDGQFCKLKAETPKKKDVESFVKILKANKFESTLCESLVPALMKTPEECSDFDKLAISSFEVAIAEKIAAHTKAIEEATATKENCAAATATAKSGLDAAKASEDAAKTESANAATAAKEGDKSARDAKKALRSNGPALKAAAGAAKETNAALEKFVSGPLAAFNELRDRETPKEPSEEEAAPSEPAQKAADPAPES